MNSNDRESFLKLPLKRLLEIGVIAVAVIVIDQTSKLMVRNALAIRETWAPIEALGDYFQIVHWKNTGVAFGLFPGVGWMMPFAGLVFLALIVLFYSPILNGSFSFAIAIGLQLGGAIGNLIDRLNPEIGYVVDFIWIWKYPVFNLADCAVVIGAGILLITLWKNDSAAAKKAQPPEPGDAPTKDFNTASTADKAHE